MALNSDKYLSSELAPFKFSVRILMESDLEHPGGPTIIIGSLL